MRRRLLGVGAGTEQSTEMKTGVCLTGFASSSSEPTPTWPDLRGSTSSSSDPAPTLEEPTGAASVEESRMALLRTELSWMELEDGVARTELEGGSLEDGLAADDALAEAWMYRARVSRRMATGAQWLVSRQTALSPRQGADRLRSTPGLATDSRPPRRGSTTLGARSHSGRRSAEGHAEARHESTALERCGADRLHADKIGKEEGIGEGMTVCRMFPTTDARTHGGGRRMNQTLLHQKLSTLWSF